MSSKNSINDILYKIRKTREIKNYTQEYVASKLGIDTKSYSNIENGLSKLSVERLIKISEVLETSPESLINATQNFLFTHCSQSGYLNNPSFGEDGFKEAKNAWITLVNELKSEINFLRSQLQKSQH
jgi:transcriptional regulator with XRE-family HTH domain